MKPLSNINFRNNLKLSDADAIFNIVTKTGFFNAEEALVAKELADETLVKGFSSGYEFVIAECEDNVVGYACYGMIPATDNRYDLYWIAVLPEFQKQKLGTKILELSEGAIKAKNGEHIYIETSSKPEYEKTRNFYLKNKYQEVARLNDFYRQNDSKVIYLKKL